MGFYIHSLSESPLDAERDYYIYVLDYGWHEPLGEALRENFTHMASLASNNKAIVLAGIDSRAFADEVFSVHFDSPQFSWSNINGQSGEEILPAIMISTIHPQKFRSGTCDYQPRISSTGMADEKLIIIPLRGACKNSTEVVVLIEQIFRDVARKKPLANFAVSKKINAGNRGSFWDAVILRPAVYGCGVDLKELARSFMQKRT